MQRNQEVQEFKTYQLFNTSYFENITSILYTNAGKVF